ncbi:MAG: MjaI family restriction endonuclease [Flavobacteriales bacterium]|nr:MjaI family restriction endonuclease [Flavobacteriales bacterium]
MALIRECQPETIEEWESWYFENATTAGKNTFKITRESLTELGERLYEKITEVVIPEWQEAFSKLTKQDCHDYIYNLTINRTYDGFLREKSVVNDDLSKRFPAVRFEESPPELDHAGDIDYLGFLCEEIAFGIQIKPITSKANFGNYKPSERMQAGFNNFTRDYKGNVFIVYSVDKEVANSEIYDQIQKEIDRLKSFCK